MRRRSFWRKPRRPSRASGSSNSPITKKIAVSDRDLPRPIASFIAPIANVRPAPTRRPTVVTNANPPARASVGYTSGSHSENTAKSAPPMPSRTSSTRNRVRSPDWNAHRNTSGSPTAMQPISIARVPLRPKRSASRGTIRQVTSVKPAMIEPPIAIRYGAFIEMPSWSCRVVSAVGTNSVPPYRPVITGTMTSDSTIVSRRCSESKIVRNELLMLSLGPSSRFFFSQRSGSCALKRM